MKQNVFENFQVISFHRNVTPRKKILTKLHFLYARTYELLSYVCCVWHGISCSFNSLALRDVTDVHQSRMKSNKDEVVFRLRFILWFEYTLWLSLSIIQIFEKFTCFMVFFVHIEWVASMSFGIPCLDIDISSTFRLRHTVHQRKQVN